MVSYCTCCYIEMKACSRLHYTAVVSIVQATVLALGHCWTVLSTLPSAHMLHAEVTQWPQGPSSTSPPRINSALTSGILPSLQSVWGHVFQTSWSCVFLCRLCQHNCISYENIARRTAAYPVPCRRQWGRTKKKPYQWCYTGWSGVRQSTMCGLCLLLIKSQYDREVDRWLPHTELTAGAAEHRWLMTSALEAYCHCHCGVSCGSESLDHVI